MASHTSPLVRQNTRPLASEQGAYLRRRQTENYQQQATTNHHDPQQDRIRPTPDSSNSQNERNEQQENRPPTTPSHRWEGTIATFTVLLTFITGMQVWTYMASERAVVTVENFSVSLVPDKPLVINWSVRNSGRTTAFIIDMNVTTRIGPNLEKIPQYKPMGRVSIKGPLVAGGVVSATTKDRKSTRLNSSHRL